MRLEGLLAVFHHHGPERHLRALRDPVIVKPFVVLYGGDGARRRFFIFQRENAERSRADEVTGLAIGFIDQVDHIQIDPLLLVFAG